MKKKKNIENSPPEFLIMNSKAEYFAGMRGGYFYWSSSFNEAKEFTEVEKYDFILKHEPYQNPEMIYVKDL